MKSLRLALDWTPNTNHIGFFVAKELGFYKEEGIEVTLLNPNDNNYVLTPAKKVEKGLADLALAPFESVISYRIKVNSFDAVAIATIFQEDLSAIVVLEESAIHSPKDLDGKSYASYKARYEDEIVRQMIMNDGGKGYLSLAYPNKLGIWDTLLSKTYDSTWVFMNWEGVQAQNRNIQLRDFRLADYGIPYGYSPIILTSKKAVQADQKQYEAFMRATKRGFLFAKNNPDKATAILYQHLPENDRDIDLLKSQEVSMRAYGDDGQWGLMDQERVNLFLDWLRRKKLETTQLTYQDLVYPLTF